MIFRTVISLQIKFDAVQTFTADPKVNVFIYLITK
jgi:hypothetical protein